MPPKDNQRSIILFAVAGLVIILLAGGMAGLTFDGGRVFAEQAPTGGGIAPGSRLDYRLLLVLFGILLLSSVFLLFLNREDRRRVLIFLAIAGLIALVLIRSMSRLAFEVPPPSPTVLLIVQQTPVPTEIIPTPVPVLVEEDPPRDAPDWLVTLIGVTLSFFIAGVLGLLYLSVYRRKVRLALPGVLADEAEQAVAAIQDGEEIRDVILRCYAQMVRHLEEARSLQRGRSVTPREFEHLLIRIGFPAIPMQTLTLLFEAARYGHQAASPEQTQQALESLQAIVNYAGEAGGR